MAKVQNTFIKSRMNKDLDDRLLSNGEYRNAQNVSVSRSEGEDVGALENVLGNKFLTNFGLSSISGVTSIGKYMDISNDRIIIFLTNYSDTTTDQLSRPAPGGSTCSIVSYNTLLDTFDVLVKGVFLNFSTTHLILGISLIEDLLFWTDNRNQPRKINIKTAAADPNYYTTEDQISVAKYYPYKTPKLSQTITRGGRITSNILSGSTSNLIEGMYLSFIGLDKNIQVRIKKISSSTSAILETFDTNPGSSVISPNLDFTFRSINYTSTTMTDTVREYLPPSFTAYGIPVVNFVIIANNPTNKIRISQANITGQDASIIEPGMEVTCGSFLTDVFIDSVLVSSTTGDALITLNKDIPPRSGFFPNNSSSQIAFMFHYKNPNYDANWPGDKEFLTDRFVRFAYRFKFDDGEYSLISPFTQPAFIPKQDGYILSVPSGEAAGVKQSQEVAMSRSTIVQFFENKVTNVKLNIETPYAVNQLDTTLKIKEIDIVYKESNGLAFKILETVSVTDTSISSNSSFLYTYEYQSRRPTKVLPQRETTRVYDKIPVRAKAQSSSGNRVIYGNFFDKHTPPLTLDFGVAISNKSSAGAGAVGGSIILGDYSPTTDITYAFEAVSTSLPITSSNTTATFQLTTSEKADNVLTCLSGGTGYSVGDEITFNTQGFPGSTGDLTFKLTALNLNNATSLIGVGSNVEYPTATLKQNRTYQVGIVLSDRYGRQSDVIQSSIGNNTITSNGIVFKGSTVYSPYTEDNPFYWFGDSMKICFNSKIPETVTYADGYPGLYDSGIRNLVAVSFASDGVNTIYTLQSWNEAISLGSTVSGVSINGAYTSIILSIDKEKNKITIEGEHDLSPGINANVTLFTAANPLGWYSYKVVVKQTQQDYYNVYVPNILSGEPRSYRDRTKAASSSSTSYITLISDNINKIPPDLQEVQPEQTNFPSSDSILYPRVANPNLFVGIRTGQQPEVPGASQSLGDTLQPYNSVQYNLGTEFVTVETIAKVTDMGIDTNNPRNQTTTPETGIVCLQLAQSHNNNGNEFEGTMQAPPGGVFTKILFASYGRPAGGTIGTGGENSPNNNCGNFTINSSCHSVSSKAVMETILLGFNSKTFIANDAQFGDPCPGDYRKWLYVKAEYEISSTTVEEINRKTEARGIYNPNSNPTVAKLNTQNNFIGNDSDSRIFGVYEDDEAEADAGSNSFFSNLFSNPLAGTEVFSNEPCVGILEVKPLESLIDIYWETSTSGLISELNDAIG
jgi:hypothetical protein